MTRIPMLMECPVEGLMGPSSGLRPNAFSHAVWSEGNPEICFSINIYQ